jgi:hypothetical protein
MAEQSHSQQRERSTGSTRLPSGSSDVMRFATLAATAFEAGSRKAETDVLDEICNEYGLSLTKIEQTATRNFAATLRPFRRTQLVRDAVAKALAEESQTIEALATTVLRRTKGFVAMLDEIYGCLAKAEATTSGNSDIFRLRVADVDIGIQLSPAFFERVRSAMRVLTTVELGTIDSDKLSRFLNIDYDFYGSWPLDGKNAINLARQLTYLPWLISFLKNRTPRGDLDASIDSCRVAATTFVTSALRLVRGYVALLRQEADEAEEKTIPEEPRPDNPSREERLVLIDRTLLRERGVLRGGLRSRTMGLPTIVDWGFTHVFVDTLFSTPDTMGSAPNCMVTLEREVQSNFYGTPIGGLACLCGLWKAGIQREPEHDSDLSKVLAGGPNGITAWLHDLEVSLLGASQWLTNEVWTPSGTSKREDVVEVFEDYLNLPLWRQRWLIYEIWLISITLDAANRAGWQSKLTLDEDGQTKTWVLPKGPASVPCATLNQPGQEGSDLHVWYQGRWKRAGVDMMPDVALTTVQPPIRDVVLVEGKDRYRMPLKNLQHGALEVGRKYSEASGAAFTWIVNYCPFPTSQGVGPSVNHGDAWHALFLAGEVRPGRVPQDFYDSVAAALQPWTQRVNSIKKKAGHVSTLVFVCDTTQSMTKHLRAFWTSMRDVLLARGGQNQFSAFRAILFGDHDAYQEPYLLRHVGPSLHPAWVIDQALREPDTNGGDTPEALEDAIKACRDVAGRLGQPVCCIVATDAPPHPVEHCPNNIDFRVEVDAFLREGNVCILVTDWLKREAALPWKEFEANPRVLRVDLDKPDELLTILQSVGLLVT